MDEIIIVKNESHYLWPMKYYKGNSTKCFQCQYYRQYDKPGLYWDGECTSVCANTERGYVHRTDGNDHTSANDMACKWFLLREELKDD